MRGALRMMILVHIREIGQFAALLAVRTAVLLVAVAAVGIATVARTAGTGTAVATVFAATTVAVATAVTITTVATRFLLFITFRFREQHLV